MFSCVFCVWDFWIILQNLFKVLVVFVHYAASPSQYNVHLFGGSSLNEGRVEIFYNGQWGTVCDDNWHLKNGHVVCRQLGYADAVRVSRGAEFGAGTGRIWLDNVNCVGTENMLSSCRASPWGSHDCRHNEDAGVVCRTGT